MQQPGSENPGTAMRWDDPVHVRALVERIRKEVERAGLAGFDAEDVTWTVLEGQWRAAMSRPELISSRDHAFNAAALAARGRAIDHIRHEAALRRAASQRPQQAAADGRHEGDLTDRLESALVALTEAQREYVRLRYYHGFKHAQLRVILNLNESQLKNLSRTASKVLRSALGDHDTD